MALSNIDVTVADVRTDLGEIDTGTIPDSVIQSKIDDAKVEVEPYVHPNASDAQVALAVKHVAAYESFNALPRKSQESEMGVSNSYNVDSYLEFLERRRDKWLDRIEAPVRGSKGGLRSDIL